MSSPADRFSFGKFKGDRVTDVPTTYLTWCFETCENLSPSLRRAIQRELASRLGFRTTPPSRMPVALPDPDVCEAARVLISAGYRAVAKRAHPDTGGHHLLMLQLGQARDWLVGVLEVSA
jgi:hypothetical protein